MPETLQNFGCSPMSALLKGSLLPSPGLEAPAAGGGESFPSWGPWVQSAQVFSATFVSFRLSLAPVDAAEPCGHRLKACP